MRVPCLSRPILPGPCPLRRMAAWGVLWGVLAAGCSDPKATAARQAIVGEHLPRVRQLVEEDRTRIRDGLRTAAERLAPGFGIQDPKRREAQLRAALRQVRNMEAPSQVRIPKLAISPVSFLAAVGSDGVVIARDAKPDRMRGEAFGKRFPAVREALEGRESEALVTFEGIEKGGARNVHHSWLFAQPVRAEGSVVGALVAGVPLWREAQRLSRQLRLEHASQIAKGMSLWVYLFVGDRLYHFGTPPELDPYVPDARTRSEGLARSPKGFDGSFDAFHRVSGYGVYPLPRLAEGVGVIIVRSDPP